MNFTTGKMQSNADNRAVNQYASYNGLIWKKGIDISWTQNGKKVARDYLMMRYADVLLMYAEAKIELNELDKSVTDAINSVRARAYGVNLTDTGLYPACRSALRRDAARLCASNAAWSLPTKDSAIWILSAGSWLQKRLTATTT